MMALQVGLRRMPAPAAILGYSGALLAGDKLKEQMHGRPPVLLIHGDADEVVPVEAMFAALQVLAAADCPARFHFSPATGPGIGSHGLPPGRAFLADYLSRRAPEL